MCWGGGERSTLQPIQASGLPPVQLLLPKEESALTSRKRRPRGAVGTLKSCEQDRSSRTQVLGPELGRGNEESQAASVTP